MKGSLWLQGAGQYFEMTDELFSWVYIVMSRGLVGIECLNGFWEIDSDGDLELLKKSFGDAFVNGILHVLDSQIRWNSHKNYWQSH